MRAPGPSAARGRRSSPSRLSGFEWSLPGQQVKARSATFGQPPTRRTPHRGGRPGEPRCGRCAYVACGLGLLLALLLVSRLATWDTVVRQGTALLADTNLRAFRTNGTAGASPAPLDPGAAVPDSPALSSAGEERSTRQGSHAALEGSSSAVAGEWHRAQAARGSKAGLPGEEGDARDEGTGAGEAGSDSAMGEQSFFPEDEGGMQKPGKAGLAEGDAVAGDAKDGRRARRTTRQQLRRRHSKGQVSVGSNLGNKAHLDSVLGTLDSVRQLSPHFAARGHGAGRKRRKAYEEGEEEGETQGTKDSTEEYDEADRRTAGRHRRLGHTAGRGEGEMDSASIHGAAVNSGEKTRVSLAHSSRKRGGVGLDDIEEQATGDADNAGRESRAEARGHTGGLRRTGVRHRADDLDPGAEVDALLTALEKEQTTRVTARNGIRAGAASGIRSSGHAGSAHPALRSRSLVAEARIEDDLEGSAQQGKVSRTRRRAEHDREASERSAKGLRSRLRVEDEAYEEQGHEEAVGRARNIEVVEDDSEAGHLRRRVGASAVGTVRGAALGSRVEARTAAQKISLRSSVLGSWEETAGSDQQTGEENGETDRSEREARGRTRGIATSAAEAGAHEEGKQRKAVLRTADNAGTESEGVHEEDTGKSDAAETSEDGESASTQNAKKSAHADVVDEYEERDIARAAGTSSRADTNTAHERTLATQGVGDEDEGSERAQASGGKGAHDFATRDQLRASRVSALTGTAARSAQGGTGNRGDAEDTEEQDRGSAGPGDALGAVTAQRQAHEEEQPEPRQGAAVGTALDGTTEAGGAAAADAQTTEEGESGEEEGMATTSFQKAGIPEKTKGNEVEEEEEEDDYKPQRTSVVKQKTPQGSRQQGHIGEDEANDIDD